MNRRQLFAGIVAVPVVGMADITQGDEAWASYAYQCGSCKMVMDAEFQGEEALTWCVNPSCPRGNIKFHHPMVRLERA